MQGQKYYGFSVDSATMLCYNCYYHKSEFAAYVIDWKCRGRCPHRPLTSRWSIGLMWASAPTILHPYITRSTDERKQIMLNVQSKRVYERIVIAPPLAQRQILIYLSNRIKYNAPKRINAWGQNFYMGIRLMSAVFFAGRGGCSKGSSSIDIHYISV